MYEPILFRDRSRPVQIVLSGVIPAVAGAIAGVLVGVSSSAYWAYAVLAAIGASRPASSTETGGAGPVGVSWPAWPMALPSYWST